jgi:hypothetical protein
MKARVRCIRVTCDCACCSRVTDELRLRCIRVAFACIRSHPLRSCSLLLLLTLTADFSLAVIYCEHLLSRCFASRRGALLVSFFFCLPTYAMCKIYFTSTARRNKN